MIPFAHCYVSPKAAEYVAQTLRSGWLNEGPRVRDFEKSLEDVLGLKNVVAVNSDTSAMHLALLLSNISVWNEVIVSPQTFIAQGTVVKMCGAKPVFADIDPTTGNLSVASVREKVAILTKAIMPVHWSGYPADLEELQAIASYRDISVIEDAAHALGATYHGRPIGAISRFACFSFQSTKHVTGGEGGAIACQRAEDAAILRELRWFGVSRDEKWGWTLGERDAVAERLGYKYHMNDVTASIALANLETFPERLAKRQERGAYYREALAKVPGLTLLDYKEDRTHAYWFFIVLVERRLAFVRKLKEMGFETSIVHRRIDRHPVLGGITPGLVGQEQFEERQIALPLHEGMTDLDCDRMLRVIQEGW